MFFYFCFSGNRCFLCANGMYESVVFILSLKPCSPHCVCSSHAEGQLRCSPHSVCSSRAEGRLRCSSSCVCSSRAEGRLRCSPCCVCSSRSAAVQKAG